MFEQNPWIDDRHEQQLVDELNSMSTHEPEKKSS